MIKIRQLLENVASVETAYNNEYNEDISKLHNHCGCVAFWLQSLWGGKVVTAKIDGIRHYWNKIENEEFDFTSDQFGGNGFRPIKGVCGKKAHLSSRNPRFKLFAARMNAQKIPSVFFTEPVGRCLVVKSGIMSLHTKKTLTINKRIKLSK